MDPCPQYFRNDLYREFLDAPCHKTFAYADANQRDNVRVVALKGVIAEEADAVLFAL